MIEATSNHDAVADVLVESCLEQILSDQVRDWLGGDCRRVNVYLDRQPSLRGRTDAMLEMINQEVVLAPTARGHAMLGRLPRRFSGVGRAALTAF